MFADDVGFKAVVAVPVVGTAAAAVGTVGWGGIGAEGALDGRTGWESGQRNLHVMRLARLFPVCKSGFRARLGQPGWARTRFRGAAW